MPSKPRFKTSPPRPTFRGRRKRRRSIERLPGSATR
jgi:hypothetical protein